MSNKQATPPSSTQKIVIAAQSGNATHFTDARYPSQVLVDIFTVDVDAIYRKRGIEKPSCTNVELKHKPCQK